jgi:hypothetical protein
VSRLLVLLALGLAGCTLFEDDPPDRTCDSNADCFEAQGEVCDVDTGECVVAASPDGGAP